MVDQQSLPWPALSWPVHWDREAIAETAVALEFRLYPLLYLGYAATLAIRWRRDRKADRPFGSPVLLAVVLFGAVYFTRSLGRSDEAHLASAVPPVCLLLAHLTSRLSRRARRFLSAQHVGAADAAVISIALAAWVLVSGADRAFAPYARDLGLENAAADTQGYAEKRRNFAAQIERIRENRERNGLRVVVLDLSAQPMLYVRMGWMGPGGLDVVMPGTFLDEAEERRFLRRVIAARPEGVFWPDADFDGLSERAVAAVAPRLVAWARAFSGEAGAGPGAPGPGSRE
jgi:hypothetical protein